VRLDAAREPGRKRPAQEGRQGPGQAGTIARRRLRRGTPCSFCWPWLRWSTWASVCPSSPCAA